MGSAVYRQVTLVLGLISAIFTFEHLGSGPVFSLHVTLQVHLSLEDLMAFRTDFHSISGGRTKVTGYRRLGSLLARYVAIYLLFDVGRVLLRHDRWQRAQEVSGFRQVGVRSRGRRFRRGRTREIRRLVLIAGWLRGLDDQRTLGQGFQHRGRRAGPGQLVVSRCDLGTAFLHVRTPTWAVPVQPDSREVLSVGHRIMFHAAVVHHRFIPIPVIGVEGAIVRVRSGVVGVRRGTHEVREVVLSSFGTSRWHNITQKFDWTNVYCGVGTVK